jgi:hypothetical protein
MEEPREHVAALRQARERLVESRRANAKSALSHESGLVSAPLDRIVEFQAQIEAVDRALADEELLTPKKSTYQSMSGRSN